MTASFMKRLSLLAALIASTSLSCLGQTSVSGSISASGATCATTNACVVINLIPTPSIASATVSVTVAATFTGTLQFEESGDNGNTWVAAYGTLNSGGTSVTSTTTTGLWVFSVAALTNFRVRASALSANAATITIQSSPAQLSIPPGTSSTPNIVTGPLAISGPAPWIDVTHPSFGAKPDYQNLSNGAMGIGSSTLTSSSNKFVPADVGKIVTVQGAGYTAPTNAGSSTATTGGSIATGVTIFFSGTWVGPNGESVGFTEATQATAGGTQTNTVTITHPSNPPAGATGWVPYAGYKTSYDFKQIVAGSAPSAAPIVTQAAGTIPAGTYLVSVTCGFGVTSESPPSPDQTVVEDGAHNMIVARPVGCSPWATTWRVYASTVGGAHSTETEQILDDRSLTRSATMTITAANLTTTGAPVPIGCVMNAAGTGCGLTADWTGTYIAIGTPGLPASSNLITTIASYNSPGSVGLTVGNQSGAALSSKLIEWATDSLIGIQAAIDAAEALKDVNGANITRILLPFGTYAISGMINWKSAALIGTVMNTGARINWMGPYNGVAINESTQLSNNAMHNITWTGGSLNIPGYWLTFAGYVDQNLSISDVQFQWATGDCVYLNGWWNLHWTRIRFDGCGVYAIHAAQLTGQSWSSFRFSDFTYDNLAYAGEPFGPAGFVLWDQPNGNAGGSLAKLSDGRIELNTSIGSGFCTTGTTVCGELVTWKPGTSARTMVTQLENIALFSVSSASDFLLYNDTATAASHQSFQLINVRANNQTPLGGTWNGFTFPIPGDQGNYSFVDSSRGVISKLAMANSSYEAVNIDNTTTAYGARKKADSQDAFIISPNGDLNWGPGNGATDTSFKRTAIGLLGINLGMQFTTTTVGALPAVAGAAGSVYVVSDSTAVATEGQTCAGSSTFKALAFSNGTVWKCF